MQLLPLLPFSVLPLMQPLCDINEGSYNDVTAASSIHYMSTPDIAAAAAAAAAASAAAVAAAAACNCS